MSSAPPANHAREESGELRNEQATGPAITETEATDEELTAAEVGDDDLLQLPPETWAAIRLAGWELLDVAEMEGPDRGYAVAPCQRLRL